MARVTGTHRELDLAYLEPVDIDEYVPIAIGDSDDVRQGDEVIAIGFPLGSELGADPTVTTGIISAKRKTRTTFRPTPLSIQATAAGRCWTATDS